MSFVEKKVTYNLKLEIPCLGVNVSKEVSEQDLKDTHMVIHRLNASLNALFGELAPQSPKHPHAFTYGAVTKEAVAAVWEKIKDITTIFDAQKVEELSGLGKNQVYAVLYFLTDKGCLEKIKVGRFVSWKLKKQNLQMNTPIPAIDCATPESQSLTEESRKLLLNTTNERLSSR